MNLVKLSDKNFEQLGEKPSLVFEGEEFTNLRLNEMSRRLAAGLKALGIGRGDHVVVSLPNSPEVFACFGAIWRIGAVIVPTMFLLREDETRYILDHSDARAVITSRDLLRKIENARKGIGHVEHVIVLGGEDNGDLVDFYGLVNGHTPEQDTEDMDKADIALMIYTSGTTGRPKGVLLSHQNLYSNAIASLEASEPGRGDISLLCLPLAHSFGVVVMNSGNLVPYISQRNRGVSGSACGYR